MFKMSEQINELCAALAKAQAKMPRIEEDKVLAHFKSKYADLGNVVMATRPCLTENGLSVSQILQTDIETNIIYIFTMLMHSSGQYICSKLSLNPLKTGDQELAKSITYFRRYAYVSIIGAVCGEEKDHDNDGETKEDSKPIEKKQDEPFNGNAPISKPSVNKIQDMIKAKENPPKALHALLIEFRVKSIEEISIFNCKKAQAFIENYQE